MRLYPSGPGRAMDISNLINLCGCTLQDSDMQWLLEQVNSGGCTLQGQGEQWPLGNNKVM